MRSVLRRRVLQRKTSKGRLTRPDAHMISAGMLSAGVRVQFVLNAAESEVAGVFTCWLNAEQRSGPRDESL